MPFCRIYVFKFDKNANFHPHMIRIYLYTLRYYIGIGLATIEVCIFCAVTLVAALFCLKI